MASNARIFPIISDPGIKLDGTLSEGQAYVAGQHCRFNRRLPRKMGGYLKLIDGFSGPVRGDLYLYPRDNQNTLFAGSASNLQGFSFDNSGYGAAVFDITPGGFPSSANNIWQMSAMQYNPGGYQALVAHAAPNINIYNATATPVYYGNLTSTSALTAISGITTAGGIVAVYPFLFVFDVGGLVQWSTAGDLTSFPSNQYTNISAQKVLAGREDTSAGAAQPAVVFWCQDKLVRANFSGGATQFYFNTVPGYDGLLSTSSIVEYNGNYFWPGNGRFQAYNGTIQEVTNNYNLRWFYDNYNKNYRQKIWGTKIPAFGEIWWFFPYGNATECTHAIIYNIRDNFWYSTALQRSAGLFNPMFAYPLWFDATTTTGSTYPLWQHEYLFDMYDGTNVYAIESYIETGEASFVAENTMGLPPGLNQNVKTERIELDLLQTGGMSVDVLTRKYPRSPDEILSFNFGENDTTVDCRAQGRQMRFRFNSNTVGGFYEFGRSMFAVMTMEGDTKPA